MLLGFIGDPAWPWFQDFLEDKTVTLAFSGFGNGVVPLMLSSSVLVFVGLALGWKIYGRKITHADQTDPLRELQPHVFSALAHSFYIDVLYAATRLFPTSSSARLTSTASSTTAPSTPHSTKAAPPSRAAAACFRCSRPDASRATCVCSASASLCWS
jgi:hypothetical protein